MKSPDSDVFYLPGDGPGRYVATPMTAGPWTASAQHGGPFSALLGRAIEERMEPGRMVARFAVEIYSMVPIGPLTVATEILRPGRSVALLAATLTDDTSGRQLARAQAWTLPLAEDGPEPDPTTIGHDPADGHEEAAPRTWNTEGYMEAVEWRWLEGAVTRPGRGVVWMRPRIPLLPDEEMTGLQRLLVCADSASGVSSAVDADAWNFLNVDFTLHLLRPPEGEWICLDAETALGPGRAGTAMSSAYDERGLVARTAQTLYVVRR